MAGYSDWQGRPQSDLEQWEAEELHIQTSALGADNRVNYQAGDKGYSNTMAAITRQQYNDWLKRFAPTEEKLVKLATSGGLYDQQQSRNQTLANSNLARAENQASTTRAKYGLGDLRTDQQKTNLKINNGLSLASMNNEGRQAIGDLQNRIISGVSNSKGQKINKLGEQ